MGNIINNIMQFEDNKVEILEFDGKILFNPYDIGHCLELTDSAVRKAIKHMNTNQVIKIMQSKVREIHNLVIPTSGRLFLTECGVYKLIFKSNKPKAEKFSDWVTDEVLPSIRKHGAYITDDTMQKLKDNPNYIYELEEKLKENKDIINYYNTVALSSNTLSMGEFVKLLQKKGVKIGRTRLFQLLRLYKILDGKNVPYQKHMTAEHFEVTQQTVINDNNIKLVIVTRVTPKGQKYLIRKFFNDKILK